MRPVRTKYFLSTLIPNTCTLYRFVRKKMFRKHIMNSKKY